jgi:hypothetical protein
MLRCRSCYNCCHCPVDPDSPFGHSSLEMALMMHNDDEAAFRSEQGPVK